MRAPLALAALAALAAALPPALAPGAGIPTAAIVGSPDINAVLRVKASRGAAVRAVRWERCVEANCAKKIVIGRDRAYRITPGDARSYIRAVVTVRTKTVRGQVTTSLVGPVPWNSSRAPGRTPNTPFPLGTTQTIFQSNWQGKIIARWSVTPYEVTDNATDSDWGTGSPGGTYRMVRVRIRLVNVGTATQTFAPSTDVWVSYPKGSGFEAAGMMTGRYTGGPIPPLTLPAGGTGDVTGYLMVPTTAPIGECRLQLSSSTWPFWYWALSTPWSKLPL